MSQLKAVVINNANGMYRWEDTEKGWRENDPLCDFEEGDAIKIDPFPERLPQAMALWPIFGTFLEYETEDIARVHIPPASNDPCPTWFKGEPGEYYIHEGYLTPQ